MAECVVAQRLSRALYDRWSAPTSWSLCQSRSKHQTGRLRLQHPQAPASAGTANWSQ